MADNVPISAGVGTTIGTDDVGGVHFQQFKLVDGTLGSTTPAAVHATRGLSVDPRPSVVRVQVVPTVSTSPAYTAKDAIGGLLTFANAARASGLPIRVDALQVVDKAQQITHALDLVLFTATIGAPTDNNIFDPTDAELLTCCGVIAVAAADFKDFNDNAVATVRDIGLWAVPTGTSLFGALVARGTPTYVSTSDIAVTLTITQA